MVVHNKGFEPNISAIELNRGGGDIGIITMILFLSSLVNMSTFFPLTNLNLRSLSL